MVSDPVVGIDPNFCGSNWLSYRRWGHNARSIYPVASRLSF
jgi:hypothetical protein